MCYLVRQQGPEAESDASAPVAGPDRLHSRWIGAAAATLVTGLAFAAALVVAPAAPPQLDAKAQAAPAPVSSKIVSAPLMPVVEQRASGIDDGVPGTPEVAKASFGHCEHGL